MNELNYPNDQQINNADSTVNLAELIYRLLDRAVLIILAAVLGVGIMAVFPKLRSTSTYTSTSKLYLFNAEDEAVSMQSLQAMYYLVYDYLEVFQTKELHQRVSSQSGLDYTAEELTEMVTAENIEETHIISITVTANNPEDAELLANTYADVTGSLVEEKFSIPKPRIFESATPASGPAASGSKKDYILGAMAGLLIAMIAVVLFAVFDDRIYTPEDLQRAAGIETLGIMTKQKKHNFKKAEQ